MSLCLYVHQQRFASYIFNALLKNFPFLKKNGSPVSTFLVLRQQKVSDVPTFRCNSDSVTATFRLQQRFCHCNISVTTSYCNSSDVTIYRLPQRFDYNNVSVTATALTQQYFRYCSVSCWSQQWLDYCNSSDATTFLPLHHFNYNNGSVTATILMQQSISNCRDPIGIMARLLQQFECSTVRLLQICECNNVYVIPIVQLKQCFSFCGIPVTTSFRLMQRFIRVNLRRLQYYNCCNISLATTFVCRSVVSYNVLTATVF